MEVVFPVGAFVAALVLGRRSLGAGFVAVLAVGYVSGIVRANFLSVFTTFMFDAGLLGLYAAFFLGRGRDAARVWSGPAGAFVLVLTLWPALLALAPVNNFLIQLVALRATVWFLPVVLIATRLTTADLTVVGRGLAALNLVALVVGAYTYVYGVESLYPENAVTQIIHMSRDVGNFEFHRVPSTFLSAHAYGGTMLFSLPFLLNLAFGGRVRPGDRVVAAAGVVAAVVGILLCAARSPIAVFVIASVVAWVCTRFSVYVGAVAAGIVAVTVGLAATNERFQRVTTLDDTEFVETRVRSSGNEEFVELLLRYPAGAGMGSSFGTSVPYFLADDAPVPIGLENEYSRILVDQGWIGLGAWLAFVVWVLVGPPAARLGVPWQLGVVLMYALVFTSWVTAFLGAGTLASVPASVLLLAQMGVLIGVRGRGAVPRGSNP